MRILSLTAGAASMYCGSCLRDNALATELIARGHDVTLLPVYTPTLTDEPNVSGGRVFFGGVSVYLQQHFGFFRHTPRWLDRLWDSSRFIRLVSRRSIQVSIVCSTTDIFTALTPTPRILTREIITPNAFSLKRGNCRSNRHSPCV